MSAILDLLELCPDKQLVSKYCRQLDIMGNLKLRIGFSSAVQVRGVVIVPLYTSPSPIAHSSSHAR